MTRVLLAIAALAAVVVALRHRSALDADERAIAEDPEFVVGDPGLPAPTVTSSWGWQSPYVIRRGLLGPYLESAPDPDHIGWRC